MNQKLYNMECKSCGSVKFKKIRYGLYECEYCGRTIHDESESNELIQKIFEPTLIDYNTIHTGFNIIDPTRILSFKQDELDRERKMLELQMEIEEAKIKDDILQKQCSNLKRFLAKIKRML